MGAVRGHLLLFRIEVVFEKLTKPTTEVISL
jgi:hypothetical protein